MSPPANDDDDRTARARETIEKLLNEFGLMDEPPLADLGTGSPSSEAPQGSEGGNERRPMKEMTNFVFVYGGQSYGFRVEERDGVIWFVLNEVCQVLGIKNPRRVAVEMLDEDEKGVRNTYTLGGSQVLTIVSEGGVYKLAFRSRKPAARVFTKWVTSEVLPSIRRTGRYEAPGAVHTLGINRAELEGYLAADQQRVLGLVRSLSIRNGAPAMLNEVAWLSGYGIERTLRIARGLELMGYFPCIRTERPGPPGPAFNAGVLSSSEKLN